MNLHIGHDRHRIAPRVAALLVPFLLLFAVASQAAPEPVGRVISAGGQVSAFRTGESARSLTRGDAVYEGDKLRTGNRGSAQLRFRDGGLFELGPDTRFAVDRYRVEPDGGGSALLNFLRGALRTVTGSIGGSADDTYRLNTPTATVGIRGTDYSLHFCDAACARQHGGEPGLYGRVGVGAIRVSAPAGGLTVRAGRFFFVPQDGTPRVILRPPPGILVVGAGDEADAAGAAGAGDDVKITSLQGDDSDGDVTGAGVSEPVFRAGEVAEIEAPVPAGISGVSVAAAGLAPTHYQDAELFEQGDPSFTTDAQGRPVQVDFGSNRPNVANDDVVLAESGDVSDLGVGWGRWSRVFIVDGKPGEGNLAFTTTDNFTTPTALARVTGTLDYDLAGGPRAFDAQGNLWTIDTLSLNVDFGASHVGLNGFELSTVDRRLSFDDTNVQNPSLDVASNRLDLELHGEAGSGKIAGKFVGERADGAVVGFTVTSKRGEFVSGTKVLRQR